MNRNGLRWRDVPKVYGPHEAFYNRWKRWGEMGVFTRMMEGLSSAGAERRTVMIDATYRKRSAVARINAGDYCPSNGAPNLPS